MVEGDTVARPRLTRRQIAGVAAGNGLEFYDFLTYSFFAAQIGRTLFPQGGGHGLFLSLATFGAGFLTRPLGGLVIGRIADRHGRKPAMLLSFILMGVALIGLALTPGYAAIGMAAPLLAVGFRLLQGFALGGEVGPNTAFLLEAAPPGRRGLYVSVQAMTQDGAVLVAGFVGLALSLALSPSQLDHWGWRIAFLIGASIVPFGLAMRRTLAETLPEPGPHEVASREERRAFRLTILAGLVMLGAAAVAAYSLSYFATYAQTVLGLPSQVAFEAIITYGVTAVIADFACGWLVDRFGRKRVMIAPWGLLILYAVPSFMIMVRFPTAPVLLANTVVLTALISGVAMPSLVLFTEALPARVRAGSIGVVYALSIAIFGGSAQVIEHGLVQWSGHATAPSWYMTAVLIAGFIAMMMVPEPGRPSQGA